MTEQKLRVVLKTETDIPATHAFDVEVFPNFSMVGFRDLGSGEVTTFSNQAGIGQNFDALRTWYNKRSADNTLFVGFNSIAYDNVIARAIIVDGVYDPAALYDLSCRTIQTERVRQETIRDELAVDLLAIAGGAKATLGV